MSEAAPDAPPRAAGGPAVIERRRQHPVGPLLRLQGVGQALVVGVVAGGSGGDGPMRLLTLLPILLLVLGRAVQWATTTYEVAGGALRVDSGVLTRRRREVPLDRVQQVDVRRGLRHRLFGLCQVTVDAAGGTGGEVTLVLSNAEADRLRGVLNPSAGAGVPAPAAVGTSTPDSAGAGPHTALPPGDAGALDVAMARSRPATLVRLPPGQLALAGVTGAKQLVMLAFLGSGLQLLDDLPVGVRDGVADRVPEGTGWLVVVALLALPAWFALAAVAQLATDLGFTLTSDGTLLQVRRGFPTQREASLAVDRVQMAQIDQSLLRRTLGLVSVQLAAAGSGSSADAQVSRLTVPILAAADLDGLLGAVLPGAAPRPALVPAPAAARRRQVVRRVVPMAVGAAVMAAVLWPWGLLAATLVPVAAGAGEAAYRGLGHAATATHLVARRGGFLRRTVVVPFGRTQSAAVRQSLFQRRAGLATLVLDVAGRGNRAVAFDLPCAVAERLAHEATDAAAARADERASRRREPAA